MDRVATLVRPNPGSRKTPLFHVREQLGHGRQASGEWRLPREHRPVRWGGRNQEGAGNTIGEEVEQVNSFLSRAALTTKYMTKPHRADLEAANLNLKQELNISQEDTEQWVEDVKKWAATGRNMTSIDIMVRSITSLNSLCFFVLFLIFLLI
ncbi:hypothetical protein N1851_003063 [Merluccius polli]|uniref:Uncharacterized protein n=1 Tax=Merluccius polli TaxID=89951 RepID=A0AA47PAL2_MERPO|nr:hypothetical protein N1851_003063 [Merluccius polli]